jgi:AsmA protein
VTKGYDYEELQRSTGAQGGIMKKFVSDWKIEKGIAAADDVAMSTRENRLAVKGNMDFVNDKYENVIVALIDERGCAELTQKIHGSLNNPQFEKTSVLISAAGSVLSIIGKAGKIIPGAECEPFYKGSVQHP